MSEAPKVIHLLTSDAVLFAQKYGHPNLDTPCVGDANDIYHHDNTVTALQAKVARLEAALEELSCRHVTEGPLWWQSIARNDLRAIALDTTTATCDNTREGE